MQTAAIAYRDSELEACVQEGVWTARLANLEARARYLDLALLEVLDDASEAHRAAARLLIELPEVIQEAAEPQPAAMPPRDELDLRRRKRMAKPLRLGLNSLIFALVASTVFMLTTWLGALR